MVLVVLVVVLVVLVVVLVVLAVVFRTGSSSGKLLPVLKKPIARTTNSTTRTTKTGPDR